MYHFDFVVIQNYLVKSMMARTEAVCARTKNPGSSPGFSLQSQFYESLLKRVFVTAAPQSAPGTYPKPSGSSYVKPC